MNSHRATVHHVSRAPADAVYIGRPSRWGNPFVIGRHGNREQVIERYRTWLKAQIRAGRVTREELAELHGAALACYCAPRACHGDVLAAAAEWAATSPPPPRLAT
jgi:hypothetical protein